MAFALALAWLGVGSGEAESASFGTLILQAPVQAVASLNGEGAFLLVPGQDLQWSRLAPGNYRIAVVAGTQEWTQEVDLGAGRTETRVAVLSSPGVPLREDGGGLVLLPLPPASRPSAAAARPQTPVTATPQPKEEDHLQDAEVRRQQQQQEQLGIEREQRVAEERQREAEQRALRAEEIRQQEMEAPEPQRQKPKRPKVH
ncbi:MAG TPA: hypothetical protein DCS43_01480 [Verrucomicrobia bacterium]|nr:hypothetical protein [Verrucomicrobiota bacterium]